MAYEFLKISEEALGTSQVAQAITPAAGKKVTIIKFISSAYPSQNSATRLVWVYDHLTEPEEQLWTIKGNGEMPIDELDSNSVITNTDGVRKLAVVCENGELGPMFMSAWVKVLIE